MIFYRKILIFIVLSSLLTLSVFGQQNPSDSDFYNHSFKKYFKNGKLAVQGRYRAGLMDSVWTHYDSLGKITNTENYSEEKDFIIQRDFYPNGKIKSEKVFHNYLRTEGPEDVPKGEWKYWDDKGNLIKTEIYRDGQKNLDENGNEIK